MTGIALVDVDDLNDLAVDVANVAPAELDLLLRRAHAGHLEGDYAWLSIAWLRTAGARRDADWRGRFDAMIGYALARGWVSAEGEHVRAHLVRPGP